MRLNFSTGQKPKKQIAYQELDWIGLLWRFIRNSTTSINFQTYGVVIGTLLLIHLNILGASPTTSQISNSVYRVDQATGINASNCGSLTKPCKTIQYAVNLATSGDTILVAKGQYTSAAPCLGSANNVVVCVLFKHLTILGGYTTNNWSSNNPISNPTIIDGQNLNQGVMVIGGATEDDTSLQIDGFTIQSGLAQGAPSGGDSNTYAFGGGMLANTSLIVLRNMIFRNNSAIGGATNSAYGGAGAGGGLALISASKGTFIENVVFEGNEARGGTGPERGGVAIGGGLFTFKSIVSGNYITLTHNIAQAGSSNGSGISGGDNADAQGAGAAFQLGSDITFRNITVKNNQAFGGYAPNGIAGAAHGGGIFSELSDSIILIDFSIRDNLAQGGNGYNDLPVGSFAVGGGIGSSNSEIILDRGVIINNKALGGNGSIEAGAAGGGGASFGRTGGNTTIQITNTIIANNLVSMGTGSSFLGGGGGGGVFLLGTEATIEHTTFAQNQVGLPVMQGDAIVLLSGGPASVGTFSNNIIAEHSSFPGVAALHVQPGNTAVLERTLWADNAINTIGSNTDLNPIYLDGQTHFISSGAPNYDYHISGNSAARDQAINSSTQDDIDNESRVLFTPPDIGADEYIPIFLTVSNIGNYTLNLDWQVSKDLVSNVSHYEIVYSHGISANPPNEGSSPIDVGILTNYSLSGLSINMPYSFTIEAYDVNNSLISSSNLVTVVVKYFSYLPIISK